MLGRATALNLLSLKEALGSHDTLALIMHFPELAERYKVPVLTRLDGSNRSLEDLLRYAAVNHEYMHLLHSVATYHGLSFRWAWSSTCDLLAALFGWTRKTLADEGAVTPFPMTKWSTSTNEHLQAAWEVVSQLRAVTVQLVRYSEQWAGGTLSDVGIDTLRDSAMPVSPSVEAAGESGLLTGSTIMESHARWIECHLMNASLGASRASDVMKRLGWSWAYRGPYHLLIDRLGLERKADFPVAVDFALNGRPCAVPGSEGEWRETHPGYRFFDALSVLESLTPIEIGDLTQGGCYEERLDKIADALSYTRLSDYIYERSAMYERILDARERARRRCAEGGLGDPDLCEMGSEVDSLDPASFLHSRSLAVRRRFPAAIACPICDVEGASMLVEQMKPLFACFSGELRVTKLAEEWFSPLELEAYRCELDQYAWGSQLLGIRRQGCDDGQIECGASYFKCVKSCAGSDTCAGVFDASEGWPRPPRLEDEAVGGCPFGNYLSQRYEIDLATVVA